MKRIGNVFEKICTVENIKNAHNHARRDKTHYTSVKRVDANLDACVNSIHDMLVNHTYKVSQKDYSVTTINDKGKERELWKLPYYPHRIIQWAIMLQVERDFLSSFTSFTCASIPGRGISRAHKLMQRYLRDIEGTKYCLKIDIRHFYPSIDHAVLKQLLRRKFKDADLLWLLDTIIDSGNAVGLPIGSYLSQYLANYYLTGFDHWLKEVKGVKYVIRYADDIVVLGDDKKALHKLFDDMQTYLNDILHLTVKGNWQIFPVDARGVDFVGYRFFHGYTLLRKPTCKRMKSKLKTVSKKASEYGTLTYRQWCQINSYHGWLTWCDAYRLNEKYLVPLLPYAEQYYREKVKGVKT